MIDASRRHGRVRRDNLREDFWTDRFLFARRVSALTDRESRETREDPGGDPPRRSTNKRQATVRIIERIAGELFKIPARTGRLR
jgi:hypothetical protein